MPLRGFIAYDFALTKGAAFKNVLDYAKQLQPKELELHFPGDAGEPKEQGTIWGSLVKQQIDAADKIIAFVDLPNANVGFEIGYSCGMGKPTGVYRFKDEQHPWLNEAPLRGQFKHAAKNNKEIHDAFLSDHLVSISDTPSGGDDVLLLCPSDGEAFRGQIDAAWDWKELPLKQWNLNGSMPLQFAGIGLVVWMVTPHGKGEAERDGTENACLSILAGYAEARPEMDVRVLIHREARIVADLEHRSHRFNTNEELKKLLEELAAEWRKKVDGRRKPDPVISPTVTDDPLRSKPAHFPTRPDDVFRRESDRFIGREAELKMGADSVNGLMARFDASKGSAASGYRLIWAYGFGGMGKSWFLHRVRCLAEEQHPEIRSLVIDWDKPAWREPLSGEPRSDTDLFDVIATRLCQELGPDVADAYWKAKDIVAICNHEHRTELDRFESQLQLAGTVDTTLMHSQFEQLLRAEGLWHDVVDKRKAKVATVRQDHARYRDVFGAWCERSGHTDRCIIDPSGVRADALRQVLLLILERHPLILLLDTCEVLSHELDARMRELVSPLLRESQPLLVLMGSRLRPDLHQTLGSRKGWRAEIPAVQQNALDFGEGRRFTVADIEDALEKAAKPVEVDIPQLAEILHRLTLGIPLAVRTLLDMHDQGELAFAELQGFVEEEHPLSEQEAIRRVIANVAERFLLNLIDHPERRDDLCDIIALAILPGYDKDILGAYWGGSPVSRIKDLASRYSLLSDGDLHPSVRSFLRRYWRMHAVPAEFPQVLKRMEDALPAIPDDPVNKPADRLIHVTARLNLRSWSHGDDTVNDIARAMCLARVYEADGALLESLLRELPLKGSDHALARKLWHTDDGELLDVKEVLPWLDECAARTMKWNDEEEAGLALLHGITNAERTTNLERARGTLEKLDYASAFFGMKGLPRPAEVGRAFFDCGWSLDPLNRHGAAWHDDRWMHQAIAAYEAAAALEPLYSVVQNNVANLYAATGSNEKAERAYLNSIALDPKLALPHNGLGNLYQDNLERPEKAEEEYRAAIALDPKFVYPHIGLGHLYQQHLDQPEKAEEEYQQAIALDPKNAYPHNGLGNLYQDYLDRPEKAEEEYRAAIALDPKYAYPHIGLGSLYQDYLDLPEKAEEEYQQAIALDPKNGYPHNGLGNLYQDYLDLPEKAEEEYRQAMALDPKDGSSRRGLAWIHLLLHNDVESARKWALEASRVEFEHPGIPLAMLAIDAWEDTWTEAIKAFTSWVRKPQPKWFVRGGSYRIAALLNKAERAGQLEAFVEAIRSVQDQGHWAPSLEALEVFRGQKYEAELEDPWAQKALRRLQSFRGS